MQVSHSNDHVTHAVIGGKQAIEFGISNSAEFFNILSSTLYKDQILAVVREVLCNAWDAHIEAGCTDRPVLITLTSEKFTIQDFGKGIHHDDMGVIYGTYGNSTKKNDGNQTGGFGLGCKAPFAYTDHFEVTSCHAGIRTIYSIAKSSGQVVGKPGITPIVSMPTEESGLTVSIHIKSGDQQRFKELIKRICHNGDMNMKLNGAQLDTLNFDVSKNNFLITRANLLNTQHRVMIRYGNVMYPAEADKNEDAYRAIVAHLSTLKGHLTPFSIVFQAPAHSIAVTPSRESLSMQEHTVNTLRQLFQGFLDSLGKQFQHACATYTNKTIYQAVIEKRVDELLKREAAMPMIAKREDFLQISDFDEMAKQYLPYNYPEDLDYRKADITQRLEAMVQGNLLDRGKVQSFLRELKGVKKNCTDLRHWHIRTEENTWLQRRVIAPLMVRLTQAGLPTSQLYSCSSEDNNWQGSNRENVPPLVPAARTSPHHLLITLPYLRNIVVLTTRRQDLSTRAYAHPVFKAAGRYQGYLVYIASRKKGELEEVRQFFAQEGMVVADLTVSEAEERAARTKPDTPRKPAKKGVVKLSSVEGFSRHKIDLSLMNSADAERTEAPEFILKVSLGSAYSINSIDFWGSEHSATLVRLFGDKGGITNNTATYDKWRALGVPTFTEYVRKKICGYVLNNPRIQAYWADRPDRIATYAGRHDSLIHAIHNSKVLSSEFGLVNPMTDEDRLYFGLWESREQNTSCYTPADEVTEVSKWLFDTPISKNAEALIQKLGSPLLPLLNISELRAAINSDQGKDIPKVVALLKTILNA